MNHHPKDKQQQQQQTAAAASEGQWTTDHHLVGKHSVTRTLLCSAATTTTAAAAATAQQQQQQLPYYYVYRTHTVPIRAFEPEDPAERKPALWRGIIVARKNEEEEVDDEQQQQQQQVAVARAVDCVAADFQQEQQQQLNVAAVQVVPGGTATRLVQERYASIVYQHVLQKILPPLILKAAVEECQAQFLQQQVLAAATTATATANTATTTSAAVATVASSGGRMTTSYSSASSSPSSSAPPYYRHSPSSYLTPPAAVAAAAAANTAYNNITANDDVANHSTLPVTFTPSQLVARIKQGCAIAWQEMAPLLLVQQQQQQSQELQQQQQQRSSSSSSSIWEQQNQRRASSRLARQQEQPPPPTTAAKASTAATASTADAFQKVMPGGQIALYLKETILAAAAAAADQTTSREVTSEQDQDTKQNVDDDDDEAEKMPRNDDDDKKTEIMNHHPPPVETDNPSKAERNATAATTSVTDNNNNDDDDDNKKKETATTTTTTKSENVVPKGKGGDDDDEAEEEVAEENDGDDGDNDDEEETAVFGDEKDDDEYAPEEGEDGDEDDDEEAASYVKERAGILHVDMNDEQEDDKMDEEGDDNEEEKEEGEEKKEEEEEEIDLIHDDNPYLHATGVAILEWLGRKTAKHLSTADIQVSFPSLLHPKQTKKKEVSPKVMSKIGGDIAAFLSPTDRLIWRKMLPNYGPALITPEARFFFQIVNEEDTSEIDQWESSSFGRSQFTVRIWNQGAEEEITQRAYDEYAVAEMEYREAKAWGSWRYKGINSGYTVWPSWLDAVEAWRKEQMTGETMTTTTPSTAGRMQQRDPSGVDNSVATEDLEFAQALAEQDATAAATATRRSRRAAEGGGGGVFYGTQSNMTQKQLMDTILRLVSQNTFQTAMSIMQAIPDESTDPLRRIRVAIGKLVWKRNQLARQVVQPSWSDAAVWAAVSHSSLIIVNPDKEHTLKVECSDAEKSSLLNYIQELHKTELRLRQMVLDHLADIPIAVIATSADERAGSLEAMDDVDFENGATDQVEWRSSGHSLLGKLIYRPATTSHSDDIAPCQWYRVRDFSVPIASEPEEGESALERSPIGTAKEATTVRRRSRFRAFTAIDGSASKDEGEHLVLTEGQVCAGMKAAELEQRRVATPDRFSENPFAGARSSLVTLIPPENSSAKHVTGTVVGHNSIIDGQGSFHQRILLLPDEGSPQKETVWVRLAFPDSGVIECRIEGDPTIYTVQQFEYHSSSPAFQECRNIVNFLIRHAKAGPFLEPVDPVALNIPDYFNVIKHPMDISTLADNLDAGKYSNIPPREARGRSPTARMLNGPFRKDVELIFDNAMLFNPPVDWIHQSAAALKKSVTRKIDQAVKSAEERFVSRSREKHSIYVEEDSDADMYVYESDEDEEYVGSRQGGRKRKRSESRTPIKEESSTRSIERPTRLQKVLSESMGLRGPLSNIPVNTDASSFSLPSGWICRRRKAESHNVQEMPDGQVDTELDELIGLYKVLEEREASGLRRSTRTHHMESEVVNSGNDDAKGLVEYLFVDGSREGPNVSKEDDTLPRSRSQIELAREKLHEEYFARLYQKLQKALVCSEYGAFADGSFPPFLGQVVPAETRDSEQKQNGLQSTISRWEIRDAYLIPALRWVIRGLIRSKHLSELEPVDSSSDAGVILPNHVYYLDPKAEPFDVVDVRELTRKKRADDAAAESSDEEVELSAYEKMRAERVARNEERLKALGLA